MNLIIINMMSSVHLVFLALLILIVVIAAAGWTTLPLWVFRSLDQVSGMVVVAVVTMCSVVCADGW